MQGHSRKISICRLRDCWQNMQKINHIYIDYFSTEPYVHLLSA